MKVKLYFGQEDTIKKSGIGRAFIHQKKALDLVGIPYTTDKEDLDYDILHINTVWPDSIMLINQARRYDKKIVYHAHSTEEDFRNSFMFSNTVSGIYKKWLINLYTKGDYIITPTPYSKRLLESYGITTPIKAISNGVDLEQFNPTDKQISLFEDTYNIKKDDIIIISVGWLFERKGFDTFVEVAKQLPEYKFMWFGDVKMSRPTKKIKDLLDDLPDNVVLPGYVSGDLIKGAYGRSNIFFFPSREETEGIVVLEALACRCNILLRDIPVFSDWLHDGINCYMGKNTDEFVSIIKKMINNEYPSLIDEGYKVAKERNLSKIGKELLEVYEATLSL
ncbi:glycosyltransferase family 4 protein [uncultured Thomasclavelia sp.]|uniref:glycosyltransferase family 4 protein n=1 Tax=uncultured Thomasclavelia sp. TaxID=3025759 RepID=UPI0025ECA57C|nr:glycosyltransferase [uncultured Thomasclavelia sp.]